MYYLKPSVIDLFSLDYEHCGYEVAAVEKVHNTTHIIIIVLSSIYVIG